MGSISKLQTTKNLLILTLVALVLVRVVMMVLSASYWESTTSSLLWYLTRHSVYTLAWLSIAVFAANFTLKSTENLMNIQIQQMVNSAFWATLACLARVVVTGGHLVSIWGEIWGRPWIMAHNLLDLVVWVLLTLFFYRYYKIKKKQQQKED